MTTKTRQNTVSKSARLIGSFTLMSRVLGFCRDMLSSYVFGAGWVWDCFSIAFLIPNLFRRLFGEGALSAAFIPVFVDRLESDGRPRAFGVLYQVLLRVTAVLLALTLLGIGITLILPWFFASDGEAGKLTLVLSLTRVMLPYMLLICLTAVLGAALQGLRHFSAPAVAP